MISPSDQVPEGRVRKVRRVEQGSRVRKWRQDILRRRRDRRGGGRARRKSGAHHQAQVAAVDEARADRHAEDCAQGQQADGGGGADQPQVDVRQREDGRLVDHDQAKERAEAAEGGRGHLLVTARHVRGALRGVLETGECKSVILFICTTEMGFAIRWVLGVVKSLGAEMHDLLNLWTTS